MGKRWERRRHSRGLGFPTCVQVLRSRTCTLTAASGLAGASGLSSGGRVPELPWTMSPSRHPGPPLQEPRAADVCPDTAVLRLPTRVPQAPMASPPRGCHTWQAHQSPTWLHAGGTSVCEREASTQGFCRPSPAINPPAWEMELFIPERRFMSSECCPGAWCLSSSQRHRLHPDALPCS